ncbi:hydroxysteroid dehydrogenase [Lentinula aff. detonsa]|uniref:Hydroxysteroid dehydrogenase n=1 Tax=Lentinula aff. detonsa TaxID=2804958 RepID=A0AA38NMJ5_9AGAR|nr:hydroxysteroid dehydrogenase [Lentinula aff. detonsa]
MTDSTSPFADFQDSPIVAQAKKEVVVNQYSYTERDVILYNLGIGATETQLQWTYEGDEDFSALPTFGVIPQFSASSSLSLDWLPDFDLTKLLHGEQYLSIKAPIPTNGDLVNSARILEVLDKGNAAAVTIVVETREKHSEEVIFENQSTVFVRGSGGFGGRRTGNDRGPASAPNALPERAPDAIIEEKTHTSQAALYRLNGDINPLHILPEFAAIGGFDKPILHGLCSMGIAGKHVLQAFGLFQDIKVRFSGIVYPGETLVTEMWKEGSKVVFSEYMRIDPLISFSWYPLEKVTKVQERDTVVLSSAGASLTKKAATGAKL